MELETVLTMVVPAVVAVGGLWVAYKKMQTGMHNAYATRFAAELKAHADFRDDILEEVKTLRVQLAKNVEQLFETRKENVALRNAVVRLKREIDQLKGRSIPKPAAVARIGDRNV